MQQWNGIILLLIFFCCTGPGHRSGNRQQFPQKLDVDITEADSAWLSRFEEVDTLRNAALGFENAYSKNADVKNALQHVRVLFRYRDERLLPLFRAIAGDSTIAAVYRCVAVNVLGSMQDSLAVPVLTGLARSDNDVLAEIAVDALGKCGDERQLPLLDSIRQRTDNGYRATTAAAAVGRIRKKVPAPLGKPFLYDTLSAYRMTAFLFNPTLSGDESTFSVNELTSVIVQNRTSPVCIYPHQQYKMNPATIFNARTFGVRFDDENPWHVGEDSGFFLEGLPIHAVADGIVTCVLYEQSWGFLVGMESELPVSGTVTIIYAHLSQFIDVGVGQSVSVGDKIGDLGAAESLENGGYFAHVHWGVIRGAYRAVSFHGYDTDTAKYIDPFEFVIHENHPRGVNYKKLLFN